MNPTREQISLYDRFVNASTINLDSFTKRNNRKNYYIPHSSSQYEVLYNIAIAKLTSQLDGFKITTITYKVENLNDLKFLYKMKKEMKKNKCTIKMARKKDINNDIQVYSDFMNKEFGTNIDIYEKIYKAYFEYDKGVVK